MSTANASKGFLLPGEIAIAIQTNRPQLLNPLLARLKAGEVLPQEQVIGLVAAYQDYIQERLTIENNLNQGNLISEAIEGHLKGLNGKLEEFDALREAMEKGEAFDVVAFRKARRDEEG